MAPPDLREKARTLPPRPGVYLWKDASGQVLYVGKAQDLRARVLQYWGAGDAKRVDLMARATDVAFLTVPTVKEALVLEQTLIKQHRPPFNVILTDDKRYPYLVVTREEWPRVLYTRDLSRPGTPFGPFPDAGKAKRVARMLNRTFRLRQCRVLPRRECLYYHLGQCSAPCIQAVTPAAYADQAAQAVAFLKGRGRELAETVRREMDEVAERLQYERAADLRDLALAIESVLERQRVDAPTDEDCDAIGLAARGTRACALVLRVRQGKVVGREDYFLTQKEATPMPDTLEAFLEQLYSVVPQIPSRILLPVPMREPDALEAYLSDRHGGRVELRTPERGARRAYVDMAEENARLLLEQEFALREREGGGAVEALQAALGLADPPSRIEAFDVSHHAGKFTVASMVAFDDGQPKKSRYRRFRIRTAGGGNDPAALQEAVARRYARVLAEEGADELPDLVLIDGGRVQLDAARAALRGLGLEALPVVGLAKRFEEIYRPNRMHPLRLESGSPALHLLQRARDEAHRFAVDYQGALRDKGFLESALDAISGVGPERRRRLLATFGSVEGLRQAQVEDIAKVPGIPRPLARRIHDALSGTGRPAETP